MADAYPLAWPDGWPRTPAHLRPVGRGNFMRGRWDDGRGRRAWTVGEARDALLAELIALRDLVVLPTLQRAEARRGRP